MALIMISCGGTVVLCIVGLLILAGIEITDAIKSIGEGQKNYTSIEDVISSFGVVRKERFLPNIDYVKGDMNLVMAAPHGGYKMPKYIPNRDAGCYQNGGCVFNHKCYPKNYLKCYAIVEHDDLSKELAFLIGYEIRKIVGKAPHLVINNLARSKLDANRERHEATFDHPIAVSAYQKYHDSIEKAKATFDGPGLFLDIHGHGHPIQRTEFGYQVSGDDLDRGTLDSSNSSARALAGRFNISFNDLIRGPQSLGGLLVKRGYRAVPSPHEPGPGGNPYFDGLYDTYAHGSGNGGDVDGIMVESARDYRKPDVIATYAKDFAGAVVEFMQLYYNLQVPGQSSSIKDDVALEALSDSKVMPKAVSDIGEIKVLHNEQNDPLNNIVISNANESQDTPDNSTEGYNRFPVLLSAGLFVAVISLVMIVGAVCWKKHQRTRPSGYVSLNGEHFSVFVESE